MSIYKVYDEVWVLENGKPKKKYVYSVTQSMGFDKRFIDVHYTLVYDIIGAGVGNNKGERFTDEDMFSTKEEALLQNVINNF